MRHPIIYAVMMFVYHGCCVVFLQCSGPAGPMPDGLTLDTIECTSQKPVLECDCKKFRKQKRKLKQQ